MRTQRRVASVGEPGTDEQRVAEVEARHGGDRVVQRAEEVGAEVHLRALRDGVGEAEAGEPRRSGREGEVAGERKAGRDDERRPHGGERVGPAPMHPHEECDRDHEVERDVEDAEHARQAGHGGGRRLDAPLPEDPEGALDADDVGRVQARRRPVLAAEAADELVDAVERDSRGRLDAAGADPDQLGRGHAPKLRPQGRGRRFG